MNNRAIVKENERSKTVLHNFLSLNDNYSKRNFGGRPKVLSTRQKRKFLRFDLIGNYSSMEITKQKGLNVCR